MKLRRAPVLAIDLFCGLGGWTEGLLAEGYDVIGFDIERHEYGEEKYPAQLVLQDVLTLHGRQFKSASLIVASPPCQAYSYRAMPWTNPDGRRRRDPMAATSGLKRKYASALIAKIPLPLSRYIAATFRLPERVGFDEED